MEEQALVIPLWKTWPWQLALGMLALGLGSGALSLNRSGREVLKFMKKSTQKARVFDTWSAGGLYFARVFF